MRAIFTGYLSSAAISVALFGLTAYFYMGNEIPGGWWRPFLATTVGVLLAISIDRLTEYFTGSHSPPVQEIRRSTNTGPATTILTGIAVGYESSVWAILVIAITIIASVFIFGTIPGIAPADQVTFVLYGVAMAGIGMLTLTGNNVAMDSYGPIADNAAGHLMHTGKVDIVLVGADRIARNGDVANKIGTYKLAVLARENGIPFYSVAPTSTIDLSIASGEEIPIEERDAQEVTHIGGVPIAPEGVRAYNPAFDVTPHRYITGIVTEKGIVYPPFGRNLRRIKE